MSNLRLTDDEKQAIHEISVISQRWPKSLKLWSWSGALHIIKPGDGRTFAEADIVVLSGIPNDGGDPNSNEEAR